MSDVLHTPPAGFDDLPVEEQIEYVQALWDRISAHQDRIPVPEWHRLELDARLADYDADPAAGRSWEELEAELTAQRAARG